jgi:Zn-dependent protease with chaperone function
MRFRLHKQSADAATWRLIALFGLLVLGLVLAVNAALAGGYAILHSLLWRGTPLTFPAYFFATNTGLVLLFVLGGAAVESLRMSDGGAQVARMIGAREAYPQAGGDLGRLERRFINLVNEMAIANRMRRAPTAWIVPRDDGINAFAAGWGQDDHVVGVTRGALERLTREELQGVVAHEFGHLMGGDTRRNMHLVGLVWGLQMVHGFGQSLAEPDEWGQPPATAPVGHIVMALGWLGYVMGRLLQAAVSRQREFHADAQAVEATRVVHGLGGALRKIAAQSARDEGSRAAQASSSGTIHMAHLLLHHRSASWATHPPIAERLRRLYGRTMEPLDDAVQPAPVEERVMAFAASNTTRPANAASDAGAVAHADPVQASTFDAMQPNRNQAREASLRDALMRIHRWHGPREKRAGTLALLFDAHDQAAWERWTNLIDHEPTTQRVKADIQSLTPEMRVEAFKTLVSRSRDDLPADRALLRQQAKLLTDTLTDGPAARAARGRLHRLVLLRLLRVAAPSKTRRSGEPLSQHLQGAIMSTAALAVAVAGGDASRWLGHVRDHVQANTIQAPPKPRWSMRALLRVHSVDQARLVQAWIKATRKLGLVADDCSRESLQFAALALGVATPSLR